jgi:hypothetical protein
MPAAIELRIAVEHLVRQVGGIVMLLNWTFWAVVAALLSAFFAAWYTWLTYRLVRGQNEPNVVIYVRHDESRRSILQIAIENIGRGLATDIRFKPSRPIPAQAWSVSEKESGPAQPMTEGPFVHGIASLGPGDARTISWGQYWGLKKALGDQPITVTCEYKHGKRQMPAVTAVLDIASFAGTDALESEGARMIKELTRIAESLKQIASSKQEGPGV